MAANRESCPGPSGMDFTLLWQMEVASHNELPMLDFMLGGLAFGEWRSRRYAKRIEHAQPLYAFTDENPLRSAFDDVGSVLDAGVPDLVEDKGTYVSLHELSR
ncbi:hypothetical protein J8273_0582 [Carpediemonas membranifera]|uniref:Uncharacterized protein n=1 Tax=Carpediemonas membranifera TaxID=201153 RepID=A0A8J6AUV5_9EUKA|nr:hypothetical protein J8273_0582 [Carpediemonas membranifera]|eukprot:KAG9395341.1 hypothetical protein J8273_0582 [Carpediemonas membranifera]